MKTIYRVEHHDRRHGPYPASWDDMTDECLDLAYKLQRECDLEAHPPPSYDGIDDHSKDHHCGFESLQDLFDWFEHWLEELEEHDYHIAVFEVEDKDTLHGGKQVMFKRKKYRRKQALQLNEVRNETRRRSEAVA